MSVYFMHSAQIELCNRFLRNSSLHKKLLHDAINTDLIMVHNLIWSCGVFYVQYCY